jgi:hypothetical protein
MSAAHESGHDDQQLVRYLLGLLPDEDTERLDEMSIADEEVAARVGVVEDDLVDAYVRGTMPDDTRARFESVYLSSPRRRQKVRFAESFLRAVDPPGAPAADTHDVSPRPSSSGRMGPRPASWWGLALAAALVLLAGGAVVLNEMRLRNGLHEAQSARDTLDRRAHELEQQLESERTATAAATQELERVRTSLAELTLRSSSAGAPGQAAAASPAPTMVALVLPPQTRSGGPVATMAVPPGAERLAFELQLEGNDFTRYEVTLKDPATGRIVWRSNEIGARSSGDLSLISIVVPAGGLKSQHYSLELTGYGAAGARQVLSSYSFRIVRR